MKIEKAIRINNLYDFYEPLLSVKQREVIQQYYLDDFSLAEIAENLGVSRQAASNLIKRTESLLEVLEEQLRLAHKYAIRRRLLMDLQHLVVDPLGLKKIAELMALDEDDG